MAPNAYTRCLFSIVQSVVIFPCGLHSPAAAYMDKIGPGYSGGLVLPPGPRDCHVTTPEQRADLQDPCF